MRLMAVAAGDAQREHLALLERAVVVDLVAHLPVGIVEPTRERRNDVRIRKPPARHPILGKLTAPRMAKPAGLDLLAQLRRREIPSRISGACIRPPDDVLPFIKAHQQALAWVLAVPKGPPAILMFCPGDMLRALTMAGLAADADLRPSRSKAIGC